MYDVIVVGLGGMGSAVAAHLAQRGQSVVGFEQFWPVHDRGSSHGKTRIIRQAYYEDPAYVPLLLRGYELWDELEQRSNLRLRVRTGGLMVGLSTSELVTGTQRSVSEHGLAHEVLDAADIRRRFPAMRPRADELGIFEAPAGMLFPELCVRAHLEWATHAGADLRFNTRIERWGADGTKTFAQTAGGERIEAGSLVLCSGAWLQAASGLAHFPVRAERNVMHWFEPEAGSVATLQELPVYILDRGTPMLYGFPYIRGEGIKAAFHRSGVFTTPQMLERAVSGDEVASVRSALEAWLPEAAARHSAAVVCMYELTPDGHFIVGRHPTFRNVIVAGGFSGHGFKFCSVMGEIVADLALEGGTRHPISLFSPSRFPQ